MKCKNICCRLSADQLQSTLTQRKSNIELMRLVCMFFIVIYHFVVKTNEGWQFDKFLSTLVLPLHGAVICFILITGYFGTSISIKKVISLIVQTSFYCVLSYMLVSIFTNSFNIKGLVISFLFLTHNPDLWFIRTYMLFLLCIPILNKWIDTPPIRIVGW